MVYGLSSVLARLLNFLLLPFYTHYLPAGEYGVVAAAFAYVAFLNILFQYGMDQAYLRFASEGEGRDSLSTPVWSLAATSLLFSAILHLAAVPLASLAGLSGREDLVRLCAWILALDALAIIPFAELRLKHRAWLFAGIKTFNIAVNLSMNIALVAGLGLGVRGVFLASLTASAATLALLGPVLAARLRAAFDRPLWARMLRFSLPLVPAGLGSMAVQVIDRPILLSLTDARTVGIYQANYRLGIFMMLVVNMFDQAWRPFYLQKAKDADSGAVFGRVFTYYLSAAAWITLALSLFIPDLARFPILGRPIIHEAYWGGLGLVPIVLSAYLLDGCYMNFMASILLSKRTELLVWITLLGAAVNVAANLILIPHWGMLGAAWATFAAYAAMAAALFVLARRVHPIPYEWGRVLHLAAVLAGALLFLSGARTACAACPAAWLAARVFTLLSIPAALYWTGFLTAGEKSSLSSRLRS